MNKFYLSLITLFILMLSQLAAQTTHSANTDNHTLHAQGSRSFAGGDGSENNPYQVTSWQELDAVRNSLSDHFILMQDLDEHSPGYDDFASSSANDGNGWEPIGNSFSGAFNGNNKTISGLTIDRNVNGVGLFSEIANSAKVENLALENVNIKGRERVAGITGENLGIIDNCHVSGSIESNTGTDFSNAGGIAGRNSGSDGEAVIKNSSSSATVTGNKRAIGGITGVTRDGASIENSFSTGSITGNSSSSGRVGGISGSLGGNSMITNSFATGPITSNGNLHAGGVVGRAGGTVEESFATGMVNAPNAAAGGLVGRGNENLVVNNSYAVGSVSGATTGGFIGKFADDQSIGTIINSFWDVETSGIGSAGDDNLGATGKTTAEMKDKATFTTELSADSWDFQDTWQIKEPATGFISYPYLQAFEYDEPDADPAVMPIPGIVQFFAGGDGSVETPFQIATPEQLITLSNTPEVWDKHFEQTDNIIFNSDPAQVDWNGDGTLDYDTGGDDAYGFRPIGEIDGDGPFTGSYHGGGFKIENLYINRSSSFAVGLFGLASSAHIEDLLIENATVEGGIAGAGILAGVVNDETNVADVFVSGTLTSGQINGVGGLIGQVQEESIISDSGADVVVTAPGNTGGLVGFLDESTIDNSRSSGQVASDAAAPRLGGLVGRARKGTINQSKSAAAVTSNDGGGGYCRRTHR